MTIVVVVLVFNYLGGTVAQLVGRRTCDLKAVSQSHASYPSRSGPASYLQSYTWLPSEAQCIWS